jgi:hypothetical protein
MKVIVVSGARSDVGKTHLSRALCGLLPGAVRVKIGHHVSKPDGDGNLYPMGTGFPAIAADHGNARFLIIESNRILEEITPECAIYLPAEHPKPSAGIAMKKADIIRGEPVPASKISVLAERMGCDETVIQALVKLCGESPPARPDDGPEDRGAPSSERPRRARRTKTLT